MENKELYCTVNYHFNKKIPDSLEKLITKEYMILRSVAVDELNPHFEEWNAEFEKTVKPEDHMENDPYRDYGGTAYCKFITEKQRTILKTVNNRYPWFLLELDVDDIGDIIGRTKIGNIIVNITLHPINI